MYEQYPGLTLWSNQYLPWNSEITTRWDLLYFRKFGKRHGHKGKTTHAHASPQTMPNRTSHETVMESGWPSRDFWCLRAKTRVYLANTYGLREWPRVQVMLLRLRSITTYTVYVYLLLGYCKKESYRKLERVCSQTLPCQLNKDISTWCYLLYYFII